MAKYIDVEKVFCADCEDKDRCGSPDVFCDVHSMPAEDVVPLADLKEFARDVAYQFGYIGIYNGRLHIGNGGLSTLEWAFEILGWENPHPYPEGECEWDGCHEYATCGTPTRDGYKRVCGEHYVVIKAREEALEILEEEDG